MDTDTPVDNDIQENDVYAEGNESAPTAELLVIFTVGSMATCSAGDFRFHGTF
jgi:hypothetical protein